MNAVNKLREAGAGLLISADCGTSSVAEIAHANSVGADVIVLDHHTVPQELPAALAVINPKREGSPYPFTELAAVGVAYRFLQALYESLGRELPERDFLDLVALGTVVDVAPLEDENRAIVTAGLEHMRMSPRPGVEALAGIAGTSAGRIRAETLGFGLGPRLNAAGRMQHAQTALDLLLAETPLRARQIAEELDAAQPAAPGGVRAGSAGGGEPAGRERRPPHDGGQRADARGHHRDHRGAAGRGAQPPGHRLRAGARNEPRERAHLRGLRHREGDPEGVGPAGASRRAPGGGGPHDSQRAP